jgi:ElaB/YqjD/DUF883 family membrane-anchored ribosome-binding protein
MADENQKNLNTGTSGFAPTQSDAGPADIQARFETGKAHARQAAEELRSAAEAKAQEIRAIAEAKTQEYRAKAEEALEEARLRARTFRDESEQYIRQNPTRSLLTALGVGFVLGLIFRR